jgi:hypothetical protein
VAEKAEKSEIVGELSNSTNLDEPATENFAEKPVQTEDLPAGDHETIEELGTITPQSEEVGLIEGSVSFNSAQRNTFKSLLT